MAAGGVGPPHRTSSARSGAQSSSPAPHPKSGNEEVPPAPSSRFGPPSRGVSGYRQWVGRRWIIYLAKGNRVDPSFIFLGDLNKKAIKIGERRDLPGAVLGASWGWTSKTVKVVIKWVDNVKVFITVLDMNAGGTRKSLVTGQPEPLQGQALGLERLQRALGWT